jgi:hypothetical protein
MHQIACYLKEMISYKQIVHRKSYIVNNPWVSSAALQIPLSPGSSFERLPSLVQLRPL